MCILYNCLFTFLHMQIISFHLSMLINSYCELLYLEEEFISSQNLIAPLVSSNSSFDYWFQINHVSTEALTTGLMIPLGINTELINHVSTEALNTGLMIPLGTNTKLINLACISLISKSIISYWDNKTIETKTSIMTQNKQNKNKHNDTKQTKQKQA